MNWLKIHRDRVLAYGRMVGWDSHYSMTGYLPDSPDRFRPFNVIPANTLTMRTVPHDIVAVADTGQIIIMRSNAKQPYHFPHAKWVHETPISSRSR